MFIHDLISSLISYKEDLAIERVDEDKKKKSVALKALRLESDEESKFKDEDIAMIDKKFRRFFKKQVREKSSETLKIKRRKRRQLFASDARSQGI